MPNVPRRIVVLLPTYNEATTVVAMLTAVLRAHASLEIMVIDDQSPDGTGALVKNFQATEKRVHLMERQPPRGLANAYKDGIRWALENKYDVILQMDCDFSHDPNDVPRLIQQVETTDVAIGSRYTEGGGLEGWPWHRKVLSAAGNAYARAMMGIRVRDLTSGFVCWRREALAQTIAEDISVRGYSFLILLKFLAFRKGFSIGEVPILFRDRTQGKSKMSPNIALEAILKIPTMKVTQLWKERRSFFVMLAVLFASIPLVELIVPQPQDVKTMFSWLGLAHEHGLFHIYSGDPAVVAAKLGDFSPNYPPLMFWFYYPLYAFLRFFGWSAAWPSHGANLLFRLPLFAALGLTAIAVGRFAIDRTKNPKAAWLGIGCNPALILAGPLWGQFEAVQWTCCFVGIGFLLRRQAISAGLWLAAAFLIKPQFIFFLPALVALGIRHVRARQWKAVFTFAIAITALTAPFTLVGGFSWFTEGYGRLLEKQDAMTVTGFNLWWMTARFLGWVSAEQHVLGISLKLWALGLSAGIVAGLWMRYLWGEKRPSFVPVAAAYFTSLYAFLPGMSARFLAFGLLWSLVWAVEDKKARVAAAVLSGSLLTALLYNPFFVAKSRFFGLLPVSFAVVLASLASVAVVAVSLWMIWRCSHGAQCRELESLTDGKSPVHRLEGSASLRYAS